MNKEIIEAALFISGKQLSIKFLADLIGSNEEEVLSLLKELEKKYSENSGLKLVYDEKNAQIIVNPSILPKVAFLTPYKELSKGHLKILSIVAFKNNVTQSLLVKSIGNKAYIYIKELEDKGLIKTEKFGRTKLIKTTKFFKEYFGIKK